jgi:glycerol kinase
MHWFLKNNQQAKTLARKGLLCFGTIDSFLIWKLTGGEVFATDVTNASRTQTMDLQTLRYSSEMLNLLGLKEEMLPRIHPSGGVFGVTTRGAGLPSGIPIAGVLGDQQSALFGQFCFEKGQAKITYGTGSFLLMNTAEKKIMSPRGLLTTVAWHREGDSAPTYALEGGAFICGAAVQYLRDNMGFIGTSSEVERLAKKAGSAEGVQFVPAFAGLGAPFWNPNVRGTLFGLTRGVGKEQLAYATLEAMALQNVDIVNTMIEDSQVSLKNIRVDGGASGNNLLMQMQADFQGVSVVRPKVVETTSLGAGLMAGLSVGVWSNLDDLKKLDQVDKHFKCQTRLPERTQRLAHWHKAIHAMQNYYS